MKLKRKLVSLILAAAVALPNMGVNIAAAGEIETAADEVTSSSALWVEDKTTEDTAEGLSAYSADDTALNAMATGEFSYAVEGGNIYYNNEGEITGCDETVTNAVIPGEIDGVKITIIRKDAFLYRHSLTSISLPDSVTTIGDFAFEDCSSLTSVSLPDSVTTIGLSAFSGCSSLTSISLSDSVTTIGGNAFSGCSSLTSITIPSSVTTIGNYAFDCCSGLTSISIPDSVTSIGRHAFFDCNNLTHVFFGGSETEWNDMYSSFGNSDLTNATIHYNSTAPTYIEQSGNVRYLSGWDPETGYVYFNNDTVSLYRMSESADTSGIDGFVGSYVFVTLDDENILEVAKMVPVNTHFGRVSEEGLHTLTIDGITYPVRESLILGIYEGQDIIYHLLDGTIVGVSLRGENMPANITGGDNSVLMFMPSECEFSLAEDSNSTFDLSLYVSPQEYNIDNISFTSSNPNVAEVSSAERGINSTSSIYVWVKLNLKSAGSTMITAENPSGAKTSCLVVVTGNTSTVNDDYSYGVTGGGSTSQAKSKEAQLQQALNQYNASLNAYEKNLVEALEEKKITEKSEEDIYESIKSSLEDTFVITNIDMVPEDAREACYRAIFNTLQKMSYSEIAFDKINMGADEITVSTSIVNQIADAFADEKITYSYNTYDVTVDVFGFNGATFGTLIYNQKQKPSMPVTVTFTTDKQKMAELMADYLNQLKELETNALNEVLNSTIDSLVEAIGIDKYIKSKFTKVIDKYAPELNNLGLGELVSFASDCKEVAEKIEKISKTSPNDYQSVYNEIKALSQLNPEGTSRISTTITNKAYKSLSDCRKNLIKAAINYINNTPYEPTLWDKMFSWKCPVNIVVYDSNGVEIGSIIEDEVTGGTEDVMLVKTGDLKQVYLKNGAEVSFKVTAYDYGVLNVSVEDYSDGVAIGRQNFYDIPLDLGDELTTSAKADVIETVVINTPSGERLCDEYIPAGQSAAVNVNVQIEGNGSVRNSGTYAKGDAVNLIVEADEGYRFAGWYNGDILESTSVIYDFSANEDTELTAVFKENPESLDFLYGDANADNLITAMDSASILQKVLDASFVTGIESMGGDYMTYLDVNADGMLTASDASYILQKTLDNSFKMPCEE